MTADLAGHLPHASYADRHAQGTIRETDYGAARPIDPVVSDARPGGKSPPVAGAFISECQHSYGSPLAATRISPFAIATVNMLSANTTIARSAKVNSSN